MRLRLAPEKTNIDFFALQWITFGGSMFLTVISIVLWIFMGLNFGIDFKGGTTIRMESTHKVDVGAYRQALSGMALSDVVITEVFDPTFGPEKNVALVRIAPLEGVESITPEVLSQIETALRVVDPALTFPAVESVGAKVSGELVTTAVLALCSSFPLRIHTQTSSVLVCKRQRASSSFRRF